MLGDVQYPDGSLEQFKQGFAPSWEGFGSRLRPALGNHEYYTPAAAGYFEYFNGLGVETGERDAGYYSFEEGGWKILSLNSNCSKVSCLDGSPQETWLSQQLHEANNAGQCVLGFWHHALASGGLHGDNPEVRPLWRTFRDLGGDVLLAAHDHHYQRFSRLGGDGQPAADGPMSWVVGTGGGSLRGSAWRAGTESLITNRFGLLRLSLRDGSFAWRWSGLNGLQADFGRASCRA